MSAARANIFESTRNAAGNEDAEFALQVLGDHFFESGDDIVTMVKNRKYSTQQKVVMLLECKSVLANGVDANADLVAFIEEKAVIKNLISSIKQCNRPGDLSLAVALCEVLRSMHIGPKPNPNPRW